MNEKVHDKCFLSLNSCVPSIDFSFYGRRYTPKVSQSIAAIPRMPGFLGIPSARCRKRVSRTHSSESRRSNDDVRSIAIQYRYLRSFRRAGEHVSASYVFHA